MLLERCVERPDWEGESEAHSWKALIAVTRT